MRGVLISKRRPTLGAALSVDRMSSTLPTMTLIIAAGIPDMRLRRPTESLRSRLEAMRHGLEVPTEIVVASDAPWPDPPEGVRVLVTGALSRGDKLDPASEGASGELLAFIDEAVTLTPGWQHRVCELFSDPKVGAAGGPHLLPPRVTTGQRAAGLVLSSVFGSGPLAYRFKRAPPREVKEMPTTNMVVRRSAFEAVGGFQSPSPLGDDARLCYKLRALLGLRVIYDPGLAVEAPPPPLERPFLSMLTQWGRTRGDLARRLPETSRSLPYQLPALGLVAVALLTAASIFTPVARPGLLAGALAYALAGLWMVLRSRDPAAGLLAAVGLPLSHLAYASGFWRGYFGRSLAETVPGRFRSPPLRILIMNWRDITHPWAGGAEAYMHEIASRWVRAGCDVGWLSGRYRGGKRLEVVDGIRVHRVGGHFTLYPLAAITYLLRLRKRYDLIIDCENGIPFFTPLYSRKPVVLLVHHVHAEVFRTELSKQLRWLALFLEGWMMPRVYRRNEIVAVSMGTRADLEAAGYESGRITIVQNGVDVPRAEREVKRSPAPLLLYLGRLKRYKSVDVLLRAMPQVLSRFPDAKLAIVGQGTDRERLERIAWNLGLAGSVRFHGYLDRRSRDEMLARAWVSVCPSAFEGFGVTCLEANAWGTPVVAANVPGLRDAVLDGQTGLLVPHGDSERLAMALSSLLGDPGRRLQLGMAGREWAAAHSHDLSAQLFLEKVRAIAAPSASSLPALAVDLG
jgi:glycosyltransferase involved in cell wall biosynthesis